MCISSILVFTGTFCRLDLVCPDVRPDVTESQCDMTWSGRAHTEQAARDKIILNVRHVVARLVAFVSEISLRNNYNVDTRNTCYCASCAPSFAKSAGSNSLARPLANQSRGVHLELRAHIAWYTRRGAYSGLQNGLDQSWKLAKLPKLRIITQRACLVIILLIIITIIINY